MKSFESLVHSSAILVVLHLLGWAGTYNARAQWVPQNSGTSVSLRDIAVLDSLTMIAVGDSGIILKTIDGGNVWSRRPSGTAKKIRALAFSSFDHRFLIGVGRSQQLKSTDSGDSWAVDSIGGNYVAVACSPDSVPAICMGTDNGTIRLSTDAGGTWTVTIGFRPIQTISLVHQSSSPLEARVGTDLWSGVATITDTIAWTFLSYPIILGLGEFVYGGDLRGAVQYLCGVGGGGPGGYPFVLRRGGGFGNAWQRVWIPFLPSYPSDAAAIPGTHIVYLCGAIYGLGSNEGILKSTDDGSSWVGQPITIGQPLHGISFFDENISVAVGDSGVILATRNGGVTPVEVAKGGELLMRMKLEQNYPNPFNPTTTIKYELPRASEVALSVYDMLGRQVSVLVNERKAPGSYSVTFDGSYLSSGVYFYRIVAGSFTETKRLLLIR
jgi:photosystem II stability/assembly factor-like uncharacterized protein